MKVGQDFTLPKSTFLNAEKDLRLIFQKFLENQRLLKLLYYHEADCLKKPDLTPQQKMSLINKQFAITPKINIWQDCPVYVLTSFKDYERTNNPQFRSCTVEFAILCHPDHWILGDFQLRPYKIAGEIDAMVDNQKFIGIGELQFMGCDNLVMNDQLVGLVLEYESIFSVEDELSVK